MWKRWHSVWLATARPRRAAPRRADLAGTHLRPTRGAGHEHRSTTLATPVRGTATRRLQPGDPDGHVGAARAGGAAARQHHRGARRSGRATGAGRRSSNRAGASARPHPGAVAGGYGGAGRPASDGTGHGPAADRRTGWPPGANREGTTVRAGKRAARTWFAGLALDAIGGGSERIRQPGVDSGRWPGRKCSRADDGDGDSRRRDTVGPARPGIGPRGGGRGGGAGDRLASRNATLRSDRGDSASAGRDTARRRRRRDAWPRAGRGRSRRLDSNGPGDRPSAGGIIRNGRSRIAIFRNALNPGVPDRSLPVRSVGVWSVGARST